MKNSITLLIAFSVYLLLLTNCSKAAPFWGYEIKSNKALSLNCIKKALKKTPSKFKKHPVNGVYIKGKITSLSEKIDLSISYGHQNKKTYIGVAAIFKNASSASKKASYKTFRNEALRIKPKAILLAKEFLVDLKKECGLAYKQKDIKHICRTVFCEK